MPVEVSLEMFAEGSVLLPRFTGYVSRGLFLHMLRVVDPSVSSSLHEPGRVKPYSVTPLWFRKGMRCEGGYLLDAGSWCRVGFRFLDDGLASLFLKYLYERDSVLIYDVVFRIGSVSVRSEGYGDLLDGVGDAAASLGLRFLTPTYLAVLGTEYHYMFPDQGRVFMNLMRLWNAFSDGRRFTEEEQKGYLRWLTANVGVSKYRLETRMVRMRDKKAAGFMGWITYELRDGGEWNRITQMLARYAEYSNVGGNRTGGFGVTKHKIKLGGD